MEQKRFLVTSSPHYKSGDSTRSIMGDVIIALLPILGISAIYFGWRTLTLALITVAACVAFETLFNFVVKRKNTIGDLSSVVTGLLLTFCLPVTAPYWMAVVGAFFAIVVVKMLFGGLGCNFLNPALAARALLLASWPALMTRYTAPFQYTHILFSDKMADGSLLADATTSATPLVDLKAGNLPESILDLFIGNTTGCIGETSVAIILLGGLFLLFRKVITWHIPVTYLGSVAALTFLFSQVEGENLEFMLSELFSGGLMLGAIFMATDYVTSPVTNKGKLIYGLGCGCLTVLLRFYGGYPESVTYAILLMNVVAILLDKLIRTRRYGIGGDTLDENE